MVNNEALNTIVDDVLHRQLGKAIAHLENYLYTFVQPQAQEQLQQIKSDYQLMTGYWQQGYDDPDREVVYDKLLRRMYVLATNVYIRYYLRNSAFASGVHHRVRNNGRQEWTPASLRRDMEAFVADVAMLELEPEHVRKSRQQAVYDDHQRLMTDLFDYIWTSRLWNDSVTEAFSEMLLSPTIDSNDQQMIVSAITLSTLNFFGINKFRLLMDAYMKSTDERVRQRALIGWVLCLDAAAAELYTEVHEMLRQATADERCRNDLAELQMQMVYCLRAETDNRIIQSEIIPELLKNNNIRVTRNGIEEVEDDPMEDILHPEISEQRMEKLEESVRRMADMQKQGSDIYFGGFSQMKRFPFFNMVGNWFVPYYQQHPVIGGLLERVRAGKFLRRMLDNSPFCDSDKYSFAIGFEMAVSKLPENLMQMLDRGEATLAGVEAMAQEELQSAAFLRRSYLQSLYRFFRVFPQRSEFFNPFEQREQPRYFFFANPLFRETQLEERFGEIVAFMMKHKAYDAAMMTLQNYSEERRDAQFYMMNGSVLMRTQTPANAGLTAKESYARCLDYEPDNERVWAGYARTLFGCGDYSQALEYYEKLMERHPDNRNYQLNAAVCMTNMERYDDALKILYKLNYEQPDDSNTNRVMAWTLVGARKYEQALRKYEGLVESDEALPDDVLNAAYCHWFSRDVQGAVALFRRYSQCEGVTFDAQQEFMVRESQTISHHGISDVEVRLMTDTLM